MGTQNLDTAEAIVSNSEIFELKYQNRFGVISGYLPKELDSIGIWLSEIVRKSKEANTGNFQPSVAALEKLLNTDKALEAQVTEMILEALEIHKQYEPDVPYRIYTINDMLVALDYIITRAPEYTPSVSHSAFPVSGLFVYMMATKAGWDVFRNEPFNNHLRLVLKDWCNYLDSPNSLNVITAEKNGWLSPLSVEKNNLEEFVTEETKLKDPKHWGYTSFNDFFHRQIISICRPLDGKGNDHVIVSANDGTVYRIAEDVKRVDDFEAKGQPYSLEDLLDDNYVDDFVGGTIFQSFLSGNDYHRWRAPISGTVIKAEIIPGYMFSELPDEGFDPTAGTYSQGYEANVNTRGLIVIEHDDPKIGKVCVIPIGITEISSIKINVPVGARVEKGEELGWFSYGGSSMALVFQKDAIKQFTTVNPLPNNNSDNGPFLRVKAQIAIANLSN